MKRYEQTREMNNNLTDREELVIHQDKEHKICPVSALNLRLDEINSEEYINHLQHNFYNPAVMLAASCVVDAVIYGDKSLIIRQHFEDLKRIGAESVSGYALSSSFGDAKNAFILKVTRDSLKGNVQNSKSFDELLHEYFIGRYGTNQLRLKYNILNFAYIMGMFKCSLPVIGNNKEVVSFCNENSFRGEYLVYENIIPAVSMKDFIKDPKTTFLDWLNCYMQVLYALNTANQVTGFTHYDLHTDNVLIRKFSDEPVALPYKTERGLIEYIYTTNIATIIDYGRSFIYHQNQPYGVAGLEEYGASSREPFFLYDAFKLLVFSLSYAYQYKKTEMVNKISEIFAFFNIADPLTFTLGPNRDNYDQVPAVSSLVNYDFKQFSILTLTDFIRHQANNLSTASFMGPDDGQSAVISCLVGKHHMNCENAEQFFKDIDVHLNDPVITVNNVLTYYNIRKNHPDLSIRINFETTLLEAIDEYDSLTRKIVDLYQVEKFNVQNIAAADFYNPVVYAQFKEYVERVFEIVNDYQELESLIPGLLLMSQEAGKEKLNQKINKHRAEVDQFMPRLLSSIEDVMLGIRAYSNKMEMTKLTLADTVENNHMFNWYTNILPAYYRTLGAIGAELMEKIEKMRRY